MGLNPGIRETVAWLQAHGFRTIDSGDGKTHDYECDRDRAYVVCMVDPLRMISEAERLRDLLAARGIFVEACNEDNSVPNLQAGWDAAGGDAWLDLSNVDDALLAASYVPRPPASGGEP